MSDESIPANVLVFEMSIETPEKNLVPLEFQIKYPAGLGMSALAGLHEASHKHITALYQILLDSGDQSANHLESSMILRQLEDEIEDESSTSDD